MKILCMGKARGNGPARAGPGFAGRMPAESRRLMEFGERHSSGMDMRDNSTAGKEMRRAVDAMPPARRDEFRRELQRCKDGLVEMHREYGGQF